MSTAVTSRGRVRTGTVVLVVGAVVLALVVLAPLAGWLARLPGGHATFDVLIPFELFPVTITGMLLITLGSVLVRRGRGWVLAAVTASVVLAVAGMVWAATSGIANEAGVPTGDWRVVVALTLFAMAYCAIAVAVGAATAMIVSLARQRPPE